MSGRVSQRGPEGRSGRSTVGGRRGLGIDKADPPTLLLNQARSLVDQANSYLAVQDEVQAYNSVVGQVRDRKSDLQTVAGDSDFPSGMRSEADGFLSDISNLSTVRVEDYGSASEVPSPPNSLLQAINTFLQEAGNYREKVRREAAQKYNRIVDELKNKWLPKLENFANNGALPTGIQNKAQDLITRIRDLTKISVPGS